MSVGLWDLMIWGIRMTFLLRGWNTDLLIQVHGLTGKLMGLGVIPRPRTDEKQKSNSILGFRSRRKDDGDDDDDDSDYD